MKKAKSRPQAAITAAQFSLLQWGAIAGILLFFVIFSLQAGLFNGTYLVMEGNIHGAMIYFSFLLFIAGCYLLFHWRPDGYHALLAIGSFALPLLYLISSISAVSKHSASLGIVIAFLYACFFVFGLYLARDRMPRLVLVYGIVLSCYAIVVHGLLLIFGQVYFPDGLWFTSGEYRLASIFQYSNTYAGFLSGLLLVALYGMTTAKRRMAFYLHAVMLVPILVSLMLTFSRGALVFLPMLFLLILLMLPMAGQLLFFLYLIIAGVSTLAVLGKITSVYEKIALIVQPAQSTDPAQPADPADPMSIWHALPLTGWGFMLGAAVVATLLCLAVRQYLAPMLERRILALQNKRFSNALIPAAIVVFGAVCGSVVLGSPALRSVLPTNIADRLASINFNQHSVLERKTFYLDALKVSGHYPIFGTGGGGWSAIYEEYQNNPYISSQAHSFYMQTLVEIGWVGLTFLLAFLGTVFFLFLRMHLKYPEKRGSHSLLFVLALSVLVHSIIDFDMSYVYLGALIFCSLGILLAPYGKELAWGPHRETSMKWTRAVFPGLLVILSVISLFLSYRSNSAVIQYNQAVHMAVVERKPIGEAMMALDRSLSASPHNPTFALTKAEWLTQEYKQTGDRQYLDEAGDLLSELKKKEPYNRQLILAQYRNLKDKGEYKVAVDALEEGIRKFQWDINFYETATMELSLYAERLEGDGSPEPEVDSHYRRVVELYDDVLRRIELLKQLPKEQSQGRNFNVSPYMRQAVGQAMYHMQDYKSAAGVLEPLQQENMEDPFIRKGVRYYLASLAKMGQNNESLYNLLIQADEHERMAIDALLKQ